MLDAPRIIESAAQLTAAIRLTIPRTEIQHVMGPGLAELRAAVTAQGLAPTGPWLTHHFRMDPAIFDFEIALPVSTPVAAAGRMRTGHLPATTVARAVLHGDYAGLPAAWGELDAWIAAHGYTPGAELWERYVVGPESHSNPADWRTELNRPVTR